MTMSKEQGTIFSGKIVIYDNVWIAANCVVLPNVTIGSGSVIVAGSIVTKDIPENVMAVGNPCKPKKTNYTGIGTGYYDKIRMFGLINKLSALNMKK